MQTQTLSPATDTTALISAQRDMELRASKDGYDRYIKHQDAAVSNLGGHAGAEFVKIIKGSVPLVAERIRVWLDAGNSNTGRGKRPIALSVLSRLDPDLLAFLTLNSIFAGITRVDKIASVQTTIGGQVEAEIMALDIADHQGKKVAARLRAVTAKQGSARNARKAFNKIAKEQLPEHEAWDQAVDCH